mmetsp:Transcript_8603/g.28349  ORF Transcript_8603/g.28349 Transcript_8603/m.28349 type:complete len:259 (+) Transcript_8603:627-1403(+)
MPPCPQCSSTASRGPVKQIQQWSPPVSEPEPEPPSADPASLLDSRNATAPPPPLPAPPPPRRGAPPNSAASAPRDESGWSSIEIAIWPDEIATSFESSPHEAESSGAEAEAEAEAAEAGMAEAVAAAAASADSAESGAAGRGGSGGGGGDGAQRGAARPSSASSSSSAHASCDRCSHGATKQAECSGGANWRSSGPCTTRKSVDDSRTNIQGRSSSGGSSSASASASVAARTARRERETAMKKTAPVITVSSSSRAVM